jgi:hypothetical protein
MRTWPNASGFPYASAYGFVDRTGSAVVQPTSARLYPFKFGIAKAGTKQIDWLVYPLSYFVPGIPAIRLGRISAGAGWGSPRAGGINGVGFVSA